MEEISSADRLESHGGQSQPACEEDEEDEEAEDDDEERQKANLRESAKKHLG